MSSLRLALKQSLEAKRGPRRLLPEGLSDKELRRLERQEKQRHREAKLQRREAREMERKRLRKAKREKRKEQSEELRRRIAAGGEGAEIRGPNGEESSGSTLSRSGSSSSSEESSVSSDSLSSSSSSSSDSESSLSSDSESSSSSSSSSEEGEVKGGDSSDDSSSSEDSMKAADREAKELFDADMSSDEEGEMKSTVDADERKVPKRGKQKKKARKQHAAANLIQDHWKKKTGKPPKDESEEEEAPKPSKTVQPPAPELIQFLKAMDPALARRHVSPGLRVKVRFVKKANVNGRLTRKLKWYGGVITKSVMGGSKVKIQYDDGTSEVTDFPDKEVVVDDAMNGGHRAGSGGEAFKVPEGSLDEGEEIEEGKEEEEEEEERESALPKKKRKKKNRPTVEEHGEDEACQRRRGSEPEIQIEKLQGPAPYAANKEGREESDMSISSSTAPKDGSARREGGASDEEGEVPEDGPPPPSVDVGETAGAEMGSGEGEGQAPTREKKKKKKRGPLSIHIGLPGAKRKRKEEERRRLAQERQEQEEAVASDPAGAPEEPVAKKRRLSGEGQEEMEVDRPAPETVAEEPAEGVEGPPGKGAGSLPEGELEEGEEPTKASAPTPPEEEAKQESAPPTPTSSRKAKPSIHIGAKTHSQPEDDAGEASLEAPADAEGPIEKMDVDDAPTEEQEEAAAAPPVEADAPAEVQPPVVEQVTAVAADAVVDKPDGADKPPAEPPSGSSVGTTPPPVEATVDVAQAPYSLARSGRKAAQRAAEKLVTEKKPKGRREKGSPKKKAEEDPWVQCDRCHKWRHLPHSVDLNSLPDTWFCELNTYDAKRNNCEAPEQTPKEVAKEKKRAKKLALKKLQMEQAQAEALAAKEAKGRKDRSTASDQELEFDASHAGGRKDDEDELTSGPSRGNSPKPPSKPKAKRGRPRREDARRAGASAGTAVKDGPKQEWVQCEKCEKWRRLPPRISAKDLPDVWYCSMNTWDINLATCTAIEDKHEANSPQRAFGAAAAGFGDQSQIPASFGSSSKLSYRNLIFGSGRRQKNISERLRAQESLFSSQHEEGADMSVPPTVMYANSDAFYNKSLPKATPDEEGGGGQVPVRTSIFDVVSSSRVWHELNNHSAQFHSSSEAAYRSVGIDKFCRPDGTLTQDAEDTLKAMCFFSLANRNLVAHEILLEVQCSPAWNVPAHWLELRSICTIEIVTYILEKLVQDGLVEATGAQSLDGVVYRRRLLGADPSMVPVQQAVGQH
ncbi:hypothetical protein ACHAXT_009329 [Thalassiosira profunda]